MQAITKDMIVASVFESHPAARDVFKKFGFGALADPVLRNTVGRTVSIEKACRHHGVDLDAFLADLAKAVNP